MANARIQKIPVTNLKVADRCKERMRRTEKVFNTWAFPWFPCDILGCLNYIQLCEPLWYCSVLRMQVALCQSWVLNIQVAMQDMEFMIILLSKHPSVFPDALKLKVLTILGCWTSMFRVCHLTWILGIKHACCQPGVFKKFQMVTVFSSRKTSCSAAHWGNSPRHRWRLFSAMLRTPSLQRRKAWHQSTIHNHPWLSPTHRQVLSQKSKMILLASLKIWFVTINSFKKMHAYSIRIHMKWDTPTIFLEWQERHANICWTELEATPPGSGRLITTRGSLHGS